MGKTARKKKHDSKMQRKRAAKAAKRTKYAALAGASRKAKRQKSRKMRSTYKHGHVMVNCGNVGCKSCFPQLNTVTRRERFVIEESAAA